MLSDEKIKEIQTLAHKVKSSNRLAFNKLFDMLWESHFIFAKSLIIDESNAKDIVQDTWVDFWNNRKKIENPDTILGYLHTTIRFKVYNHFRNNKLHRENLEIVETYTYTSDIELQHNLEDKQYRLNETLKDLTPRCKEIFKLSRFENLNNSDIASQLGISKRSVENQLSFALKKLKPILLFVFSFLGT